MITEKVFDQIENPAVIAKNNFIHKSLCICSYNIAVGCVHGCPFCYVPEVSAIKQESNLEKKGIIPTSWIEQRLEGKHWADDNWGNYSLLRTWDEKAFLSSLRAAQKSMDHPIDGNRAIMFCSTTDPYQTLPVPGNPQKTALLATVRKQLVRRALELILHESDLNVRILTRSPLAQEDFDLYKEFGNRLLFGMSIPTIDSTWSAIYEPNAPGPVAKYRALQQAVAEGINVYVALAPTIPDEGEMELRNTIEHLIALKPVTIFHEPINLRADNLARIEAKAREQGRTVNSAVFQDREHWREYAFHQFALVEKICADLNIPQGVLHQWPDQDLASKAGFMEMKKMQAARDHNVTSFTGEIKEAAEAQWESEWLPWIQYWHNSQERISSWPPCSPSWEQIQNTTPNL